MTTPDGCVHAEPQQKAEILADQYSSVFTKDELDDNRDAEIFGPDFPAISDLVIDAGGVEKLLRNLNPSKATEPDQIPARLLKELAHELAQPVTKIFQATYDTGELPNSWKEAWISAVYKKGPKSLPSNYRPVSLTCILAKLNEHVINTHVRRRIDTHDIITSSQRGFQKRHSCESQLYLTVHDLTKHLDRKNEVHVGVLDFSKAFDVVPHRRLLSKLRFYGITGKTFKWLESFLIGRTQRVVVDGANRAQKTCFPGFRRAQ